MSWVRLMGLPACGQHSEAPGQPSSQPAGGGCLWRERAVERLFDEEVLRAPCHDRRVRPPERPASFFLGAELCSVSTHALYCWLAVLQRHHKMPPKCYKKKCPVGLHRNLKDQILQVPGNLHEAWASARSHSEVTGDVCVCSRVWGECMCLGSVCVSVRGEHACGGQSLQRPRAGAPRVQPWEAGRGAGPVASSWRTGLFPR